MSRSAGILFIACSARRYVRTRRCRSLAGGVDQFYPSTRLGLSAVVKGVGTVDYTSES